MGSLRSKEKCPNKQSIKKPATTIRVQALRVFTVCLRVYLETVASEGSLERRHHFSSWLISVTSMPGITMNLQESISRGSSSSGSWQVTRQYWQSWFQQKRP